MNDAKSVNVAAADQITEQQRRLWNAFSPGWEKWDEFVMSWLQPIGDELLVKARLKEDSTVLDVSTGTGEPGLSAAAIVSHGQVVATDVSEGMVRIANGKAKTRGITNFAAQVADGVHLPFDDYAFDAVLCRLGVMFFSDPLAGVQEMTRVLKRGGRISLAAWDLPTKNPWGPTASKAIFELLKLPAPTLDTPGPFRHSAPDALRTLVEQTGLTEIEETEVTGEMVFDSPDHYWEFVMDVFAPVAKALENADEANRRQAKEAVIAATQPYQREGRVVFDWSCRVVSGAKKKPDLDASN